MRIAIIGGLIGTLALGAPLGCAMGQKKVEKELASPPPVNCETAEGDIRVLRSEKAHVAGQIAAGVTAIFPAGLVIGILTGTEGTKLRVATGEYNRKIDARIADIQRTCGIDG